MTRLLTRPQKGISEIVVQILPLWRKNYQSQNYQRAQEKLCFDMRSLFNGTLNETCEVTNLFQDLKY